jgi:hypothetical protein
LLEKSNGGFGIEFRFGGGSFDGPFEVIDDIYYQNQGMSTKKRVENFARKFCLSPKTKIPATKEPFPQE